MGVKKVLGGSAGAEEMPAVQVGDTVKVHVKVKEGARERIQVFEGTVIAKKHGGIEETITVRRISLRGGDRHHPPGDGQQELDRSGAGLAAGCGVAGVVCGVSDRGAAAVAHSEAQQQNASTKNPPAHGREYRRDDAPH